MRLTTTGRVTGNRVPVTIWVTTDGQRIFIRSGGGLARNWPRNLIRHDHATLRMSRVEISVKARHVTDPAEARHIAEVIRAKYGASLKISRPGEALTPGELATFELLPA